MILCRRSATYLLSSCVFILCFAGSFVIYSTVWQCKTINNSKIVIKKWLKIKTKIARYHRRRENWQINISIIFVTTHCTGGVYIARACRKTTGLHCPIGVQFNENVCTSNSTYLKFRYISILRSYNSVIILLGI